MATKNSQRLPLWRTVVDAYAITLRNVNYLVRLSWLWVVLFAPIAFAYHLMARRAGWTNPSDPSSLGWQVNLVIGEVLFMPMLASIAVGWHRYVLIDEVWPSRFYLRLDRTVAAYLALAILIEGIAVVPFHAYSALALRTGTAGWIVTPLLMMLLALVVGVFISTRIWLALPAKALGRSDFILEQAWSASRHNVWRLLVGSLLCALLAWLAVVIMFVCSWGVDWSLASVAGAAWTTGLDLATTFFGGMPVVSFLSLAYRHLIASANPQP